MSGGLLNAARADAKRYIKEGGFEEEITLSTPSKNVTVNVKGLATKHHLSFDSDGLQVNAKNAHITLDEKELIDLGYPVRVNEEILLINHLVSVPDSSGIIKNYVINNVFPDETLGLIVCVLGDYEEI